MSDVILRQGDIDRFTEILNRLIGKTKAALCVLIHKDGHLLASVGTTSLLDSTALAALISANFSSTVAIAHMLGEREFNAQIHKGKSKSIYISLVDDDTFLSTIIDNKINIETVRIYTDEYAKDLANALHILYQNLPEPFPEDETPDIPLDTQIQINPEDLIAALQKDTLAQPTREETVAQPETVQARALPHTAKGPVKGMEPSPAPVDPARKPVSASKGKSASRDDKTEAPANKGYLKRKVQEVQSFDRKKSSDALFSRVFTKRAR